MYEGIACFFFFDCRVAELTASSPTFSPYIQRSGQKLEARSVARWDRKSRRRRASITGKDARRRQQREIRERREGDSSLAHTSGSLSLVEERARAQRGRGLCAMWSSSSKASHSRQRCERAGVMSRFNSRQAIPLFLHKETREIRQKVG